jgi:hypothetical protein
MLKSGAQIVRGRDAHHFPHFLDSLCSVHSSRQGEISHKEHKEHEEECGGGGWPRLVGLIAEGRTSTGTATPLTLTLSLMERGSGCGPVIGVR